MISPLSTSGSLGSTSLQTLCDSSADDLLASMVRFASTRWMECCTVISGTTSTR